MQITNTIERDGDTFIILQSENGQIALNAACAEAFAEGDTNQAKNVIRTTKYLKEISNRTITEAEANEALTVAAASLNVQEEDEAEEGDVISENLESEYKDAIQNDTVTVCDNAVEFENWAQSEFGFAEFNDTSYAKYDESGDYLIYSRNDETREWSQWS